MENACTLCYSLVLHNKPHPALKKISELKGSELYKCCCCYAYLHKHEANWEIISGGEFMGAPKQSASKTMPADSNLSMPAELRSN
jgi:hypothetical protein